MKNLASVAILLNRAEKIVSAPPAAPEDADDVESTEVRAFTLPAALHGERLDKALAALVPTLSRNWLRQLVLDGAAHVNHAPACKPARKVRAGDEITVELRPTPESRAFVPQAMRLDVVYEDDHVLVVNKPAGLVVHPAPGHWGGTLLNGLLARDPHAATLPRAGIVHRLDKDTTGLMVVARSQRAMDVLVQRIAAHAVRREYVALAHGHWEFGAAHEVDAPVGRDPRSRVRMAVVDLARDPGKWAQTRFELLSDAADVCLLRCLLRTGRTHQIRVHAAHLGHPLVGDILYGGKPAAGLERQALHARRLSFAHPVTDAAMDFEAPLPSDLAAALDFWKLTI